VSIRPSLTAISSQNSRALGLKFGIIIILVAQNLLTRFLISCLEADIFNFNNIQRQRAVFCNKIQREKIGVGYNMKQTLAVRYFFLRKKYPST